MTDTLWSDDNICAKCRIFMDEEELKNHSVTCTGPCNTTIQTRWYFPDELRSIYHESLRTKRMFHTVEREFLTALNS